MSRNFHMNRLTKNACVISELQVLQLRCCMVRCQNTPSTNTVTDSTFSTSRRNNYF